MTNQSIIQNLDENQAAKILGVAVQTLRNWRHQCRGPAYVKMGRSVRYQVNDLVDYLNKKKIDPELSMCR
jgi:predicted site-specific integrase-resolvase